MIKAIFLEILELNSATREVKEMPESRTLDYEDLPGKVDEEGGLCVMTMGVLRDAHGVGKLGVQICKSISEKISAQGLGHLPAVLPASQGEEVRLFRLGSSIAQTVDAILSPNEDGDNLLRRNAGPDAQEILKKIRDLVCE